MYINFLFKLIYECGIFNFCSHIGDYLFGDDIDALSTMVNIFLFKV